ncbi:hypothetical protein BH11PSE12_BH11PSE12_05840 [soil metagenome]
MYPGAMPSSGQAEIVNYGSFYRNRNGNGEVLAIAGDRSKLSQFYGIFSQSAAPYLSSEKSSTDSILVLFYHRGASQP